jgi:N-glycosylase/DNA lyase
MKLPEEYQIIYIERRDIIQKRLEEFRSINAGDLFYELCFCLLTPQSKQVNAEKVTKTLMENMFYEYQFDPTSYLRKKDSYIRFHNVKSRRLLELKNIFPEVVNLLQTDQSPFVKRERLLGLVKGIGLKEASHFLRNTGHCGLAILDRHILKHLLNLNIIDQIPKSLSVKIYYDIEQAWLLYASKVGITLDELDLLFWSIETGEVKK